MKHVLVQKWDFPSAAILTLILLTVSQRLYATTWAPGLAMAILLAVFGVLLGLALGISKFRRGGIFWLVSGYSIGIIPLVAGWIFYRDTPWLERMINLGGRLGNSINLFAGSQPVPDTILFVVFTGLGFWIISELAGYGLTRRGDFVMAIAPAGVVLFIIQLYDSHLGDHIFSLALYAFLCLLLLGRMTYIRRRQFWKEQRVSISTEAGPDLNLAIPIAALVLIFLAWNMPAAGRPGDAFRSAWQSITRPLQEMRRNLANAIAGLQGNNQDTVIEFYGDSLRLGLQASTDNHVYMRIRVQKTDEEARYYWRVRVYDQYLDNKWESVYTFDEPYSPNQPSLPLAGQHGISRSFIFTSPQVNLAVLVTPAHPTWVSRPSILSFTPSTENYIDPLMFRAGSPILVGEQYIVHANVYEPTIAQLNQAGTTYPAWVQEHYLQLPPELSPRIPELARSITASAGTPYEKATAITNYLRANITYSVKIDTPPDGTDPLDWFLFDNRVGFCNYYATAEVILLRSLDIPARMVVGFAQGEFEDPDTYTILGKDAHAWPEVYFPNLGWVEFEPTSSQPELFRLPGGPPTPENPFSVTPDITREESEGLPSLPVGAPGTGSGSEASQDLFLRWMQFFGLLLAIFFGFVIAFVTGLLDKIIWGTHLSFRRPLPLLITGAYANRGATPPDWLKRWAYYAGLKPIEHSFGVVYQSLRWLGTKSSPAQTPAEAAATLIDRLPEVTEEIRSLLREYQHAIYSQKLQNLIIARRSMEVIRRQALRTAFHQRVASFWASVLHVFSKT